MDKWIAMKNIYSNKCLFKFQVPKIMFKCNFNKIATEIEQHVMSTLYNNRNQNSI